MSGCHAATLPRQRCNQMPPTLESFWNFKLNFVACVIIFCSFCSYSFLPNRGNYFVPTAINVSKLEMCETDSVNYVLI